MSSEEIRIPLGSISFYNRTKWISSLTWCDEWSLTIVGWEAKSLTLILEQAMRSLFTWIVENIIAQYFISCKILQFSNIILLGPNMYSKLRNIWFVSSRHLAHCLEIASLGQRIRLKYHKLPWPGLQDSYSVLS